VSVYKIPSPIWWHFTEIWRHSDYQIGDCLPSWISKLEKFHTDRLLILNFVSSYKMLHKSVNRCRVMAQTDALRYGARPPFCISKFWKLSHLIVIALTFCFLVQITKLSHLGFGPTRNRSNRSAVPENPTLEANTKLIGWSSSNNYIIIGNFQDGGQSPSWIWSNRKQMHSIRSKVDRRTCFRNIIIWSFQDGGSLKVMWRRTRTRHFGTLSCSTHRPLPTQQISFKNCTNILWTDGRILRRLY